MHDYDLETIKNWLQEADALVIHTGAGMGVDSGLADYRGDGGQWGQVENYQQKTVFEVINPQLLLDDPAYGWRFFISRMQEYASTPPHHGFYLLKSWIDHFGLDYFAQTSNIDNHLQKAGFEENRIRELHGTLTHFQSSQPAVCRDVWKNEKSLDALAQDVEKGIYPTCPNHPNIMARPNVYLFRDNTYIDVHSKEQEQRFQAFLQRNTGKNIVVFEIGSGPHVQTVRIKTRLLKTNYKARIVRINPKDYAIKAPHIGIPKGALAALTEIDMYVKSAF